MRPLGVELAAMLADRGVDTVFGIPGVHNVELYRGIEAAGLRHILVRHEQGAGFMADGYARATGRPGVCFVISGPGLTNIMTPMGQAYSDSVPMLVVASVLNETTTKRGQLHQMRDQEGAARTVCDWSETARSAEAAYGLVDRAFVEFQTDRQRPKAINFSVKLLSEGAEAPPVKSSEVSRERITNNFDPTHDIITSKRPLFILGGGARNAVAEANSVLERLGAASFTTYAGRGIVRSESPLHFGSYLARADSASVIASADLIVAVGTELASVDFWRDSFEADAPIIRVDIDPAVLNDVRGARDLIQSDAREFLTMLSDCLDTHEPFTEWTPGEVAATRARWKAEIDADRPGIVPICDALREALPQNTMIFSDMTQFAYAAKEVWDMPAPGLWHHPYGFGTLGYALPAAIGGAVGYDGPVLAIAGDYGLQYTMQELGTAAELGRSLPIMIWDNDALAEIRDCMVRAQIAPNAVTQVNPNWSLLAQAYDCGHAEPRSIDELCATVSDAFTAGRPTLIRAMPERLT